MSHTPGPWRAGGVPSIDGVCREITAVGRLIGYVASTWDKEIGDVITSEDDANVHLIAAAPELLNACKLIAACLGDWIEVADRDADTSEDERRLAIAYAAIAKAEGSGE